MTQAYAQLLDQVHTVRQSWRVRRLVEGALAAMAALAAALTVTAMVDQAFALGIAGRIGLALVLWAATGAAAWRWIIRPASVVHADDFFAALAEQRNPALRNRLINALQLGREANPAAPGLVAAIVADGAGAAAELDLTSSISSPFLKRAAIALAVAMVVALGYVGLARQAATTSMIRVLLPVANILPYTWTTLAVTPDQPSQLLEGDSLTVNATIGVRNTTAAIPEATLHWTDAAGHHRSTAMRHDAKDDHLFTYAFTSVETGFSYFVTAGDARSEPVTVAVELRPRVTAMSILYHYPTYTALPDRKLDEFDGHIHGLPQTTATLTVHANRPLDRLTFFLDGGSNSAMSATADPAVWTSEFKLTTNGVYYFKLLDKAGHDMDDPARYTITLDADAAPVVGFARPGRDIQIQPGDTTEFALVAQDDLGLGPVHLIGRINGAKETRVLQEWANTSEKPQLRLELSTKKSTDDLSLKAGDRLEYWATVEDLNNVSPTGPGRGESRHFNILVLTPEQAHMLMERQLNEYAKVLTELIRLQRLNRTETAATPPAPPLIDRQSLIRRTTQQLADTMQHNAFPLQTMIDELRRLASDPMAKVVTLLESFRDATNAEMGKDSAAQSLPVQDAIIQSLQEMLKRIDRDEVVRKDLQKMEKTDLAAHKQVTTSLAKLSSDLDKFLAEEHQLEEKYEKMRKKDDNDTNGEDLKALSDALHQFDRWKQWTKDTVDAIAKLPDGFVKDSSLIETVNSVFEEVEKEAKPKGGVNHMETPAEEGGKPDSSKTKVLEDLEVWSPHGGDNTKWTMEDPAEGKFNVPPAALPATLQDQVADLVEDAKDFDEKADDVTSSWGANIPQAGWDIVDGPISSFAANGKTGNQLPNNQEISGRSGSGRRGKSSGQNVGDTSEAMEGRPTPARLTNEPYEAGNPKAEKQLDPHGSTGGGRKTGGGALGLQGGTPPDFVKDMDRLKEQQKTLKEKTQQLAHQLENTGKPLTHLNRALQMLDSSQQDFTDGHYDDAARRRKSAISELKAEQGQIDQSVNLSLDRAPNLPPELRQQISAGSQQALPEGYEDLVGAYYKAISSAASSSTTPGSGNKDDGK